MKLASRFARDLLEENSVDYLSDKDLIDSTNVMFNSMKTFVEELKGYTDQNSSHFVLKDASDLKRTCSDPFTIDDAVQISDVYIDSLWTAIRSRLSYTDMSESAAAYSEAPAEGIFSTYARVSTGRPRATHDHLVALTRIAAHGPPVATPAAAELSKDALKNLKSVYGERFCTQTWFQGKTSNTVQALKNKSWDW